MYDPEDKDHQIHLDEPRSGTNPSVVLLLLLAIQ
jgi:hypothetical protein